MAATVPFPFEKNLSTSKVYKHNFRTNLRQGFPLVRTIT